MQSLVSTIVLLGTGGTIAGTALDAADNVGYVAGRLGAAELLAAVPASASLVVEVEQVAQIDSKDMGHAVWRALAAAVERHLSRQEVQGIVITHGTDTLEETAYFLQRVLAPVKPVVVTGAMRPATSLQADGPQNLSDALAVAREPGAHGVVVVMAGKVHGALDVRKVHPYRLDAFGSGDAGVLAHVEEGVLRRHRDWPVSPASGLTHLPRQIAKWPTVEIVTSHSESSGRIVEALRRDGVEGLVVAATGNGSLHHALEAALIEAQAAGLAVLVCTRTLGGRVIEATPGPLPIAGSLTPVQARIELMLRLLDRAGD